VPDEGRAHRGSASGRRASRDGAAGAVPRDRSRSGSYSGRRHSKRGDAEMEAEAAAAAAAAEAAEAAAATWREQLARHQSERARFLSRDLFVFPYGCVVFWGFTGEEEERALLAKLGPFADQPVPHVESDDLTFSFASSAAAGFHIGNDAIALHTDDPMERLAVSFALAQSMRLSVAEERVNGVINSTRWLPEELARTGKISLTRNEISRMIGQLFLERASVNLDTDLLDTPDFLWSGSQVWEDVYKLVRRYFDVSNRVAVLNERLLVIKELLDVLRSSQEGEHGHRLETIVIWLIVVEIFISLGLDVCYHLIVKDVLHLV
jgi:uncharacterized Rmd1/YagE family protein